MSFKDAIISASKAVNTVLGDRCDYTHKDGSFTSDVFITINENKEVKGDFGILAGYQVEASILKSDIEKVRVDDSFSDEKQRVWRIVEILKSTSAKFYVNLMEIT